MNAARRSRPNCSSRCSGRSATATTRRPQVKLCVHERSSEEAGPRRRGIFHVVPPEAPLFGGPVARQPPVGGPRRRAARGRRSRSPSWGVRSSDAILRRAGRGASAVLRGIVLVRRDSERISRSGASGARGVEAAAPLQDRFFPGIPRVVVVGVGLKPTTRGERQNTTGVVAAPVRHRFSVSKAPRASRSPA